MKTLLFCWLQDYLSAALFLLLATFGLVSLVYGIAWGAGLGMSPRSLLGELEWVFSAPFRLVGLVTGYYGPQQTIHGIGAVHAINRFLVVLIVIFPTVPLSFFWQQGRAIWKIWVFAGVLVIYWSGYAMDQFCNHYWATGMFGLSCPWYRL